MPYLNTGVETGKTQFTDVVSNAAGPNVVNIKNKRTAFRVGTTSTTAVSGSISLVEPQAIEGCDPCDKSTFNSSMSIAWNIQAGDATRLAALRLEVDRIFDLMISDFYLDQGLTPPATSTLV